MNSSVKKVRINKQPGRFLNVDICKIKDAIWILYCGLPILVKV